MPYKNILWLKLEHRLLNDSRFFLMAEKSQLIFVKLLMIAAQTDNKIPKKAEILKELLRTKLSISDIELSITEIRKNFPKFKKSLLYYYFEEWDSRVNWTPKRELPRNSQGTPKDFHNREREEEIRIRIRKEESDLFSKLKDWNERQRSPMSNFKPENIINKHGASRIEKLLSQYGKRDNGFSQFLAALKK